MDSTQIVSVGQAPAGRSAGGADATRRLYAGAAFLLLVAMFLGFSSSSISTGGRQGDVRSLRRSAG